MAALPRVVRHDHTSHMNLIRLEVLRQTPFIQFLSGNSIISHHREREHQNLTSIRRICERLRIANHSRIEHDLSRTRYAFSERKSTQKQGQTRTLQRRFRRLGSTFPSRYLYQCRYLRSLERPYNLRKRYFRTLHRLTYPPTRGRVHNNFRDNDLSVCGEILAKKVFPLFPWFSSRAIPQYNGPLLLDLSLALTIHPRYMGLNIWLCK